jgi:lipid-A-disaccharide synthase
MAEIKHIFIVCGEASGDLHAANLAKAIFEKNPHAKISGVGGKLLKEAKVKIYYDIKDLSVIGLFDVLKKLPKFLFLKKLILEKIKTERPDAIILVDFSGFNLRLAKAIKKSIPVIYYISPQVWASRRGRIKSIKKYVDKLIVLFEFEKEFYKKYGINADYVGHPLLDIASPLMQKEKFINEFHIYDPYESHPIIALLPGSRQEEVKRILPLMLEAGLLIKQTIDGAQFLVVKSPQLSWDIYHPITHAFKKELKVIEGKTYDCLNVADFAMVCSGTATLETAIMQKPFVVIYKTGLLNYLLYLPQIRIPYISLANILARKKVIPELIQFKATPRNIYREVIKLLTNPLEKERIKKELAQIRSLLGNQGANQRAAGIILDFLKTLPLAKPNFITPYRISS